MKDLGEAFEQLTSRVDALEKRVSRLEQSSAEERPQAPALETIRAKPELSPAPQISDTFAVFGKSLLGIAGAYVLRALADGTSIARPFIAAAGILYALAWLLAAARVSAKKLAPAFYAATSALILVPMLWEMCLRFHVLSAGFAAVVLAAYTAVSTWIGWRTPNSPAFALSYTGAATAALMLSIATHAMAAFTLLLLAVLLACEIGRFLHRDALIRAAVALAADFAVWTLLFVYRTPVETRSDYPSLNAAFLIFIGSLPFLISFPGIALRVLRLHRDLAIVDIAHGMLSFILVALALLWILPGRGALVFGALCAVLAIGCYAATLGPLRGAMSSRNFTVAALWSAALTLAAAFLLFSSLGTSVALCALAIGGILLGDRLHCRTAEFHGVLYLGIATVLSGQLAYAARALVGTMPAPITWPVLVASVTAILAYVASDELPSEPWRSQSLHLVSAVLAGLSAAALLAHALVRSLALLAAPARFHIAFLRTLAVCLIAVALSFGAAHWRRLELKRVAYIALGFVASKLIFEDLRHGHLEFTAASIGLVALTVIAVPRLAQRHPA